MFKKPNFSLAYLRQTLRYDPISGVLVWLHITGSKKYDRAGTSSHGYTRIKIGGEQYAAHRLAWFLMTGKWPLHRIDHRDRNPSNNRWKNLRPCSHSQNCSNQLARKNSTGFRGVHRVASGYQARSMRDGVSYSFGVYASAVKAYAAYVKGAKRIHGPFASYEAKK